MRKCKQLPSAFGAVLALATILIASVYPSVCQAQTTVAAVLDAGGKLLSKVELSSLLKDVTLNNRDEQNARLMTSLKADGTLTGRGISSTMHEFTFYGDWKTTDANQICFDTVNHFGRSGYCEAMYKVGEKYFYASDPAGKISREHKVFERTVSKR
jgi:hypothetical protein